MATWWAVELVALTVWGWSRIQSLSATRIQLSNSDGWKYTRSWIILQWSILIWWAFFLAVSLVNTSFKIHWILQATSVGRRLIRGGLQAGSPTSLGFQRVLCSPVFRALLPCYIPPSRNQPRRAWDWASWCCGTCCRQTCDSIASSLLLLMVFDSSARWPLRSTVHRSISRRTMLWCCRCTWGCNLHGLHSSRTLFWSPPSLVSMWIYI